METKRKAPSSPTPILMVIRDAEGEVIRRVRLDYADRGHRDRVMQTIRWALAEGHSVGVRRDEA